VARPKVVSTPAFCDAITFSGVKLLMLDSIWKLPIEYAMNLCSAAIGLF